MHPFLFSTELEEDKITTDCFNAAFLTPISCGVYAILSAKSFRIFCLHSPISEALKWRRHDKRCIFYINIKLLRNFKY